MPRSSLLREPVRFLPVFFLAVAASAATVQSSKPSSTIRLDGKTDEWAAAVRVIDPKTGAEFAFQNDAQNLYILVVMKKPESLQAVEATGMTVLGRPGGSRKPAKGALFLTREISADGYIVWRESQGAVLTDEEKAEIRKFPRHSISLAFAVDAKGSSYGPLRKQTDAFPPDFLASLQDGAAIYEFRIPLAPPDLVPGGIGGQPGGTLRISFDWGGLDRSSLSTQASRESPSSRSGYVSGTGRTWGQEYLDSYDSMSRPTLSTKKFTFAVDVKLADID